MRRHVQAAPTPYLAGRAMRSYSSGSTYAMRNLEPPPPRRPSTAAARLTAAPSCQASEPNTMHSLFASLCGMRPHLGMDKPDYSDKQRLARCLPAELQAAGIHSAFYTTSNVGLQKDLGYGEVWSSVEDYTVGDWRSSAEDQNKYPGERIGTRDTTGRILWPPGSGGGTPPQSSCVGAPRACTIGSATTTTSVCPRRASPCAPAFA